MENESTKAAADVGKADGVGFLRREECGWTMQGIKRVLSYPTVALSPQAELAMRMIERWDWLDDAPAPAEVVDNSCETAALAFAQFRDRNWLIDLPSPELITKEG